MYCLLEQYVLKQKQSSQTMWDKKQAVYVSGLSCKSVLLIMKMTECFYFLYKWYHVKVFELQVHIK